jgi:hypothetical protein
LTAERILTTLAAGSDDGHDPIFAAIEAHRVALDFANQQEEDDSGKLGLRVLARTRAEYGRLITGRSTPSNSKFRASSGFSIGDSIRSPALGVGRTPDFAKSSYIPDM